MVPDSANSAMDIVHRLSALKTEEWKNNSIDCIVSWVETNYRFCDFVKANLPKIVKKIREKRIAEDLADVRCELEVAYLLLSNNHFNIVQYERTYEERRGGPDYYVSFDTVIKFNLEVTRVRQSSSMSNYHRILQQVIKKIEKEPSSLGFYLRWKNFEFDHSAVTRLAQSQEQLVEYSIKMIQIENHRLAPGETSEHLIPDFDLHLVLSKPRAKIDLNETPYFGGFTPILYTGVEFKKLVSKTIDIKSKIAQMIPGMMNVLFIYSESDSHEASDFIRACASLDKIFQSADKATFEKYGFKDEQEFLKYWRNLSGILFRERWVPLRKDKNFYRNQLWENGHAQHQIPQNLVDPLRRIDKAYLYRQD